MFRVNGFCATAGSLAALACVAVTSNARAFIDEFDDGALDAAWEVQFTEDGDGWTFTETGGRLVVTDVVDTVDDSESNVWGRVRLTRPTDEIAGDFTFETAFSWDSQGSNAAMQSVAVGLLDAEGDRVAAAWHNDAWDDWRGGALAQAADGSTFQGFNAAPLAGTSVVEITRTGDQVKVDFVGSPLEHAGTSDAPVVGVYVEFSFYRYDAGPSFFGTESVDYVRLTAEPGTVPGDFDLDGDVDAFDLGIWQSGFGRIGDALVTDGDADGDGDVDAFDLGIWQANFGTAVGSAVPEPATLGLLTALAIALDRGRREGRGRAHAETAPRRA